jgi:hypothetical protein
MTAKPEFIPSLMTDAVMSNSNEMAGSVARLAQFLAPFIEKKFARKVVLIHCPTFNFESFKFKILLF